MPETFVNQLPERLAHELQTAEELGIEPLSIGSQSIGEVLNAGTVKWVVTENGEILIMPKVANGIELAHSVLSNGESVQAAGEAEVVEFDGTFLGLSINNHSGHYLPTAQSLDIAIQKFAEAGIHFDESGIERV